MYRNMKNKVKKQSIKIFFISLLPLNKKAMSEWEEVEPQRYNHLKLVPNPLIAQYSFIYKKREKIHHVLPF